MNPFAALAALINTARLAEPVRLWLYSVAAVVIAGFALFGGLADAGVEFALAAAGIVLGVTVPSAELARLGVYSPRTLQRAGFLPGPAHGPDSPVTITHTLTADTSGFDAALAAARAALPAVEPTLRIAVDRRRTDTTEIPRLDADRLAARDGGQR